MWGYAYHLPPFVGVAVASSTLPPSRTLAVAGSSLVHWTMVWPPVPPVRAAPPVPTVCA